MSTEKWLETDPKNQFASVKKWLKSNKCGTLMPELMIANPFSLFEDFETRPDDIFIMGFPKTGVSWLQEIVWLVANNADIETAKKSRSDERTSFIELPAQRLNTDYFTEMKSPRFLKSHVNYNLLPKQINEKKNKVIYQVRNPKDICVSFFHFSQMNNAFDYRGDFENFVDLFIEDRLPYCPFWTNVLEYWERRNDDNVLFLKYEDFHKNFEENSRAVAKFLGVSLTDEQFAKIKEHCTFKKMSANPATNYKYWDEIGMRKKEGTEFMRKGIAGDWKNHFTPEINRKMDEWIASNTEGTGLTFDYEV